MDRGKNINEFVVGEMMIVLTPEEIIPRSKSHRLSKALGDYHNCPFTLYRYGNPNPESLSMEEANKLVEKGSHVFCWTRCNYGDCPAYESYIWRTNAQGIISEA
ncbi:MAG: hypothetical protein ABIJ18_04235 [archaeon]